MPLPRPVIRFAAAQSRWDEYKDHLKTALHEAGLSHASLVTEADPGDVDYIIYAPNSDVQDFTPYVRLKAVLNLWAGVEEVTHNTTLTAPLARMVDTGLTEGMVEWVTGHVLRHHLGIDAHIHGQDGVWRAGIVPPLARDRSVAIFGMGELGTACAHALRGLNFNVLGWSRRPKEIAGVETFHGAEGLQTLLPRAEIVVLLLPDTPTTKHTLNAQTMALLPKGAMVINPGRGPLIDDDALLVALDSGQIGHATLDVFRTEPLPEEHPFWAHPKVTVTPHIASATRADTAARSVVANIRRAEAGEPLLNRVDRSLSY
jgi:glyoxylate/hydroxypyruvate reductase A